MCGSNVQLVDDVCKSADLHPSPPKKAVGEKTGDRWEHSY